MSESKSLFFDCHEMVHIWAKIQAFGQRYKHLTRFSRLVLFKVIGIRPMAPVLNTGPLEGI